MSDTLAGIGFRIDDMPCADALQNTRMLLRHGLRPDIGDAGIQQVSGGDDGSLNAIADGHDCRVEI